MFKKCIYFSSQNAMRINIRKDVIELQVQGGLPARYQYCVEREKPWIIVLKAEMVEETPIDFVKNIEYFYIINKERLLANGKEKNRI